MTSPTTATATVPKLQFKVPGAVTAPPPLDIPAPPSAELAPIASQLEPVATSPEARQGVNCKDMIDQSTLPQKRQEAMRLLQASLNDTDVLLGFGQAALKDVNEVIDVMLRNISAHDMGPVKALMKDAYLNLQNIKGKYDLKTPEGKKAYDEWEHGVVKRWFRKVTNYLQAMQADMLSVDTLLDRMSTDLKKRIVEARTTTKYLDELYVRNEASIYNLIDAIAVMELYVEAAQAHAKGLPDIDPNTQQENELKKRLADLIMQMNIKIGEYKGRLWVAWATSPQIRMLRLLYVGEAEKLNEAANVTIYNIKLAMVMWRTQAQAAENAKAIQNIDQLNNESMKEVAAAGANTAGLVMNAVQTPSVLPDTISAVTDSLVTMADNILQAVQAGEQRRTELSAAMGQSKQVLNASQGKFNAAMVDAIIGESTKPFALPASRPTLALPAGS